MMHQKSFHCQFCNNEFIARTDSKNMFCSHRCFGLGKRRGSHAVNGQKRCSRCQEILPEQMFFKSPHYIDGYHSRCKNCDREIRLKSRYNISLQEYNEIMKECYICGSKSHLHLDHDHETGVLRGCLCIKCNTGLGSFRDSIKLLEKAIDYLNEYYRA